jgi:hypothetical protein
MKKPQMSPTTIEPIAALEAETDAAARRPDAPVRRSDQRPPTPMI